MNLAMVLEMAAAGFGDRTAVTGGGRDLTYSELLDGADRVASVVRAAGADHLVVVDSSGVVVPLALFGSARAGVPFAPLNYRLDAARLAGLARRVSPAVAVCDPRNLATVDVAGVDAVSTAEFLDGLGAHEPITDPAAADGEAPAVVLFTSGTTGEPKAAVLRHRHLVSYVLGTVEFDSAAPDEATLVSVPPYHVAGLAVWLSAVFAGRRIVVLGDFDADAWIDTANREHITHAMVVPTMLARIVDRLEARDERVPSLRTLSYGGAAMPAATIEAALERLEGTDFVNAYGLTETSSTIAVLGPDDHRAAVASDDPAVRRRLGSAGRPLPSVEVSIRDDDGTPVPAQVTGEIWVRGEQVAGEYRGTGSLLDDDGWFHTNDGGWFDDDGYLFVTGRLDDVIIRGGENISPGEIEDVLTAHPDVAAAACVGAPDDHWGEVVAAFVVTADGVTVDADDLRERVRCELRSSKVPEIVTFVDELPFNENGKLLRRQLRDAASAGMGDNR